MKLAHLPRRQSWWLVPFMTVLGITWGYFIGYQAGRARTLRELEADRIAVDR